MSLLTLVFLGQQIYVLMKKQDTQYMDTIVQNKFNITNLSYEQKDGLAFAFNIFYHNYADPDDDLDIFDVLEFSIRDT